MKRAGESTEVPASMEHHVIMVPAVERQRQSPWSLLDIQLSSKIL